MKITLKLTSFTSLEQYIRDLSYLSIKSITYSRIILHRLTIEWWSWLEAPYAGILVYLSQCCIYMRQWIQVGFGSDNGSAPTRRQAFIWNNAGVLPIAPQGTNFTEILIKNENNISFKNRHLNRSSVKWWQSRPEDRWVASLWRRQWVPCTIRFNLWRRDPFHLSLRFRRPLCEAVKQSSGLLLSVRMSTALVNVSYPINWSNPLNTTLYYPSWQFWNDIRRPTIVSFNLISLWYFILCNSLCSVYFYFA